MRELKNAVAAVEKLVAEDQALLHSVLSEAVYKKAPYHKIRRGECFDALIAADFVVAIDDPVGVIVHDDLAKLRRKLCTYLSRRNEDESYLDENMEEHRIPKGAQFVATVTIGASGTGTSLVLEFPDDEITALLDQYGVNRCRGWKP